MKLSFGISIYPAYSSLEEIIDYLKLAKRYGFTKVFTSSFYLSKQHVSKYRQCFKIAKQLGFYIITDIGPETITMLNQKDSLISSNVDCLRLDTPLPIHTIVKLSKKFDIQVNASYDTNVMNELINKKVNLNKLSVMHNFYPKRYTGLSWSYFQRCNSKWITLKIHIGAFITSQFGKIGQQPLTGKPIKLPTIEKHRDLSIVDQAKQLILDGNMNDIFIGNYPASKNELISISKLSTAKNVINLKIIPNKISNAERKIVLYNNHFRRGDQSEGFIRSVAPRKYFKSLSIAPSACKKSYTVGDVVITNNNDAHYKCELWIINQNNLKLNHDFNYVGHIKKDDLWKLELIDSWTKFKIIL